MHRHYVMQVILFYLLTYLFPLVSLPFQLVAQQLEGISSAGPKGTDFFKMVILGPIIETLIFQFFIFKLFQLIKSGGNKYLVYIGSSALAFGLSHYFSIRYIIFAVSIGLVLAYMLYFYHHNMKKAFWTTALVHAMHNCTLYLLMYFKLLS